MSFTSVQHRETLPALGAGGYTDAIQVTDFKDISFSLAGAGGSQLTVRVLGSLKKEAPDFTAAAAVDNEYQAIICQSYEDDAPADGNAGITFTSDAVQLFSASVDGLDWIAFQVSAHTSGTVAPKVSLHNN